jgi:YVTN family beta-propeller protein
MVISRRSLLAVPFVAACGTRGTPGYRGYAFVANEEGQAVAAVDLQALAVARHIPLDAAPAQVVAAQTRPSVYALTPATGSIHEIQSDRLSFKQKLPVGSTAVSMRLAPSGQGEKGRREDRAMYVLTRDPPSLVSVALDSFQVEWRIALPGEPVDFDIASHGRTAAVSLGSNVRFIDLMTRQLSDPLGEGDYSAVRFLKDGPSLIAADRGSRRLSIYDTASTRLITHLPIAVSPDHLCFNADGGQLFLTGEGLDGVVIVYPYHTPEVAETVLAGRAPGAMAASDSFLFVASPQSGVVSILRVATLQVVAVVSVGSEPAFIAVTRDDEYALVLNRQSGDVAVLSIGSIAPDNESVRFKKAALLTVIPVGSRPVSADVKGV